MSNSRLENLAGAFGLAAADAQRATTDAAALTTLLAYPGSSIERLRRALSLTHSGGVRLVDRLAEEGLVRRRATADGRVAALELTAQGRDRAREVLAEREQALAALLDPLGEEDRVTLTRLLERVLEPLPDDRDDLERICRLCDYWTCDGSTLACPVGRGARAKRDAAHG
jgi:MarR family transcriptional regulator, negative regulator of the multidrug operon emrRAB